MKFRFRLMSEGGENRPLGHIRARVMTRIDDVEFVLAEVATNAYGYGIITLEDLDHKTLILRLSAEWSMEVDRTFLKAPFAAEFMVPEKQAAFATVCHTLDWHNEPLDLKDISAVPSAFSGLGRGVFGKDYCERMLPSDRVPEYSRMTQIRPTRDDNFECKEGGLFLSGGEALSYEVEHKFLGLSLGSLLKSTSLLPCEKVTIAVSNWQNRTSQSSSQSSDVAQQQIDTLTDSQSLNEMVSQSAKSFSVGLKVGVKVPIGDKASVNVGLGAGYSRSQADASIRQDMKRAMRATASAYRSERRVSIAEVNQSYAQQDSVRSFCNNNHCHTLNVFWRQVNENFKASVTLLGSQKVVFWPQEVYDFNAEQIACKRYLLEGNLLDAGLESCWDGFARDQAKPAPVAAPSGGSSGGGKTVSKLNMWVDIGGNGFAENNAFNVTVRMADGTEQKVSVIRDSRWKKNESYDEVVNLNPAVDPTEIAQIIVHNDSTGIESGAVEINTLEFSFSDSGKQVLYSGPVREKKIRKGGSEAFDIAYTRADDDTPPPPAVVPDPQEAADATCAVRLLHHINCNAHYYSQILWLGMDIEERRCMFSKILCRGRPLTDYLDPVPIGLWGCSLVFGRIDEPFEEAKDPTTTTELITLPTDGVYADAALGQCSSCETINEDEFRDWPKGHCSCSDAELIGGNPKPDGLNNGMLDGWGDLEDLIGNVPSAGKPSSVLAATLSALVKQNDAILTALLKSLEEKK